MHSDRFPPLPTGVSLALLLAALVGLAGCAAAPASPATGGSPTDATPGTDDATPGTDGTPGTDDATSGTDAPDETPSDTPTSAPPTGTPIDPGSYESVVFDHGGTDRPAIKGGLTYPETGNYTTTFYATVVPNASAADRFNHGVLDSEVSRFVNETDFASSSLVVVQAFPASSHPDYRVEGIGRTADGLHLRINDSSRGGTADITVETLVVRVDGPAPDPDAVTVTTEEGRSFSTADGVVTVTPAPTPTPEPEIELPYASDDSSENVDQPRSLTIRNTGSDIHGVHVTVVYYDRPDCLDETPACARPTEKIEIYEFHGKLRPGENHEVPELAARKGRYTISVEAEVPAGNGSRKTVTDSLSWTLDASSGHVAVTVSDDDVAVDEAAE